MIPEALEVTPLKARGTSVSSDGGKFATFGGNRPQQTTSDIQFWQYAGLSLSSWKPVGTIDWLYGLRRQFHQGARPQVVVVGLPRVNSFLETASAPGLFT